MLAWQLRRLGALADFDPFDMVSRGAGFLSATARLRNRSGGKRLGVFAVHARLEYRGADVRRGTLSRSWRCGNGRFIQDQADYLEDHLEEWTATTTGTLGETPYYIRILPELAGRRIPRRIRNRASCACHRAQASRDFPRATWSMADFLSLFATASGRRTIRSILNTLKIVDAVLKVDTPAGPSWHRYNHDGYGQQRDGGPFTSYGVGRAWPLLTGERGHYELAAGRSPEAYLRTMEGLASKSLPALRAGLG